MAVEDMYLKLDGVDGEARTQAHERNGDHVIFLWGHNQGQGRSAWDRARQGASEGSHVTKYVDKASPGLFQNCCNGKSFATAKLTVRKAGGEDPVEYLVYDMDEVFIPT